MKKKRKEKPHPCLGLNEFFGGINQDIYIRV